MHRNLNTILRGIYEKYEGRIRLLSEYVFVVYANSQSTWISNTKVRITRNNSIPPNSCQQLPLRKFAFPLNGLFKNDVIFLRRRGRGGAAKMTESDCWGAAKVTETESIFRRPKIPKKFSSTFLFLRE